MTIDAPIADEPEVELAKKLVKEQGEVDPTLELSKFRGPTLELLKAYNEEGITINEAELEENKEKIVETLSNYKIGIADIKATIGPTVTLYEIIPAAGIRISKIKNLEDDIALSLSALGIRIIAPIPGKGTIGIEVPTKTQPLFLSIGSGLKKLSRSRNGIAPCTWKKLAMRHLLSIWPKCRICLWLVQLDKENRLDSIPY